MLQSGPSIQHYALARLKLSAHVLLDISALHVKPGRARQIMMMRTLLKVVLLRRILLMSLILDDPLNHWYPLSLR